MTFDPDRVETVTFDSYSTLVDVGTTIRALAEHVEDPLDVGRTWRMQSLVYAFCCNAMDRYEPFWDLCEYALDYALAQHGADLDPGTRDELMAVYHDLDSFPDVRPGVERLVDAGYDCYVISNGNQEMLETMVEAADLTDLVGDTISAGDVQQYKPAPAVYEEAVERTGTPAEHVAHATAGQIDVQGGQNVGMQGVWLNRHERARTEFGPAPDATLHDIHALADELGA
jgi:2-haloacid dehalogenase